MSDQLEDQLEQYLEQLVGILKQGGQFVLDELPIFIQEYLTYYMWFHGAWIVILLGLITVIWSLRNWITNYNMEHGCWDEEDSIFTACLAGFITIIISIPLFINAFQVIKLAIAPRLYVIETLMQLVR